MTSEGSMPAKVPILCITVFIVNDMIYIQQRYIKYIIKSHVYDFWNVTRIFVRITHYKFKRTAMKGLMKFFALMLCASLVFAACDKEKPNDDKTPEHETPVTPPDEKPEEKPDDNPEEKPEDKPNEDNVQDLVIPDILFEGYYYGDYYEVGNGNAGANFIEGSLGVDEYDEYVGTGTIVCLDLNFALPDDPDHALIPAGTYVMDEAGTAEAGTWGLDESYIIKVVDGEAVYDYAGFTDGTITITETESGYKYVLDLTIDGGDKLSMEYEGPAKLKNSTEEGKFSNLSSDVKVSGLTQASMFCLGDLMEDGQSETWAISIGDKHYDLLTDYGPGYSMLLYINLEPGMSAVPAGTYSEFIDVNYAESYEVNTLIGGISMWGMYMGCFYMCPALTEEAALCKGSVTIDVTDDVYTITGTLYDGFDNAVSFEYEGEVELMVYEEYAVRSASAGRGLISKNPFSLVRK